MTQYIDKAAVVAEIERLISNGQTKLRESQERNDYESYVALSESIATCINVLSFLNTLETKEVDLEKEQKYQQMTKNSFGATVCKYGNTFLKEMDKDAISDTLKGFTNGDRVRVIIIKQE